VRPLYCICGSIMDSVWPLARRTERPGIITLEMVSRVLPGVVGVDVEGMGELGCDDRAD
jgi:hypothetical protein